MAAEHNSTNAHATREAESDHLTVAASLATMMDTNLDAANSARENMSDEEFAATEFEPWVHTPDGWTPPTNKEWAELANPHLVTIRIAWAVMHKTKPELISALGNMLEYSGETGMNGVIMTLDSLHETSNFLKGLQAIVDGALARCMVAGMQLDPDQA